MRALLLAGAAMLVLSQASMAADNTNNAQNENANQPAASQHLRANLRNMLEKSGYKDIRVAPTSFMVHARDSDGQSCDDDGEPGLLHRGHRRQHQQRRHYRLGQQRQFGAPALSSPCPTAMI